MVLIVVLCFLSVVLSARILFLPHSFAESHMESMLKYAIELGKAQHEVFVWLVTSKISFRPHENDDYGVINVTRFYATHPPSIIFQNFRKWIPGNQEVANYISGPQFPWSSHCARILNENPHLLEYFRTAKFDIVIQDEYTSVCNVAISWVTGAPFLLYATGFPAFINLFRSEIAEVSSYFPSATIPEMPMNKSFERRRLNFEAWRSAHTASEGFLLLLQRWTRRIKGLENFNMHEYWQRYLGSEANCPLLLDIPKPATTANLYGCCPDHETVPSNYTETSAEVLDRFIANVKSKRTKGEKAILVLATLGHVGHHESNYIRLLKVLNGTHGVYTIFQSQKSGDFLSTLSNETFLVVRWLLQEDLLCSGNIDLFITHGGIGGTLEGLRCRVLSVVHPLQTDQRGIAIRLAQSGAGYAVFKDDDNFEEALGCILANVIANTSAIRQAKKRLNAVVEVMHQPNAGGLLSRVALIGRHKLKLRKWLTVGNPPSLYDLRALQGLPTFILLQVLCYCVVLAVKQPQRRRTIHAMQLTLGIQLP